MEKQPITIKYVQSEELRKAMKEIDFSIEDIIKSPIKIIEFGKEDDQNAVSGRLTFRMYAKRCMGKVAGSQLYAPTLINLDDRFKFENTDYSGKIIDNLKILVENYNSIIEKLAND